MKHTLTQDTVNLAPWPAFPHSCWPVLRRVPTSPSSLGTPVETTESETGLEVGALGLKVGEPVVQIYHPADAGIPWMTDPYITIIEPETIIDPCARPMLTDRMLQILDRLLVLLKREARRSFIPVSKIEINGFVDPEEDTEEVVVTQWVKVRAEVALDYWDRLGATFEVWIDFLPDILTGIAAERLAIEVRWE